MNKHDNAIRIYINTYNQFFFQMKYCGTQQRAIEVGMALPHLPIVCLIDQSKYVMLNHLRSSKQIT